MMRASWIRALLLATGLFGALLHGVSAQASELRLFMFDSPDCEFCARWERDLGEVYPRTSEGRRAPLTHARAFSPAPDGVLLGSPIEYTPTFVLLRDGEEVGRITGYIGEDQFWGLLGRALEAAETR